MDERSSPAFAKAFADVKPGSHLGWFYASEEDHRRVVTAFLSDGLRRGERVLYILDEHPPVTVVGYLWEQGIAAGQYLAKGQLTLLSVQGTYMHERVFQPEAMIARLRQETDSALAAGYQGLRGTGEMTWALGGYPGSQRVVEYEANVNALFADRPLIGLCQYDIRRFDRAQLLAALRTHPDVIVGTEFHQNPHYSPQALLKDIDAAEAQLDAWLDPLTASGQDRRTD